MSRAPSDEGEANMDVRRLLKVYNYVNDERRLKVNYKFAGALLAFLVAGAALVGYVIVQRGAQGPADAPAAASKTDYVGLSTAEIQAGTLDARLVEQRWAAWQAEHPDATIEKREEVRAGAVVVGYRVTYHEP